MENDKEVITPQVYKNYRFFFSPASGIAVGLGALSTLEVLWLVPEKDRERKYHLALWIIITILGNSFTAYLISKRPNCTVDPEFWEQSIGLTITTIAWYCLLMRVFRTKSYLNKKR